MPYRAQSCTPSSAGEPRVGAHLVRGLPGAELLPEERADPGDAHAHAVPLPQLAGRGHPGLHPAPAGLPQVSAPAPGRWGGPGEAPRSRRESSTGAGGRELGSLTFPQSIRSS